MIVGGAVAQSIDWHWIFWINVPIGMIAVLLGLRLLPESYGAPERLDLVGAGLVTTGVVALVWALSRANQVGWSSAEVVSTLVAGTVLLTSFVWWESSISEPMVPLRMFEVRDFAIGNVTTFLMSGAIFAAGLFVTEEFQLARHYSPVGAGARLGRLERLPGHELDRARDRAPDRRRRDLDGPPDSADRRLERCRAAGDG